MGFLIASQGSGAEIQQVGRRRFEFVIFDFSGLKFPFIFQYFCILVLLEKFHLVLYFPFAPQIWGACSSVGKESVCNAGDPGSIPGSGRSPGEGRGYLRVRGRPGFDPWVGKIPWRKTWEPTSLFLPGESPQTEEPGRLQSMGSQTVGYD